MLKDAKWIWYDEQDTKNSFGEFYGEFFAKKNAAVEISCDGDYTLYINGKYAACGQYGDFEHYKSVDTVDVSSLLCQGVNKIAILVWHFGKDTQRYKRYAPGVICQVNSQGKTVFATSENTLCRRSPSYVNGFEREISSQLGYSYSYDSTKEDLWILGDGKNMKTACPVYKKCDFVPRPNEKMKLGNTVFAKSLGDGLYDLGKEYLGLLTFELSCEDQCQINIAYGECLENGHVKRKIGGRDFSVDYVAKKGKNKFTNYMLRFACRYLEITTSAKVDIKEIGLIPQFYPVKEKVNDFSGIDKEIYDICVNTLKLSMMEHYVDCPWREQCLYAFDSRNQMLSGYYAFEGGNFEYARSNLLLMSKDRRGDGLLSICYPCGIDLTIPSFSLHYIIALKEYVEYSKDTSIIKEASCKILEILNTFLKNNKDGLICTFKNPCHWNFFDWSPYADGYVSEAEKGVADVSGGILTVLALMSYKKICELCTLPFEFDEEIITLRQNIKKAFYSEKEKLFLNQGQKTELVNALAVKAEIVDGEEADFICEKLSKKEMISCSLSMKCQVYDALIKTNKEKYKSFILDDIRKTYEPMIESGTVWETVIGASDFDNAGSLCHGWSSTPIYYYSILK